MADINYGKTLASILSVGRVSETTLMVKLASNADLLAIVQGICVEYANEKIGIGKLLHDASVSVDSVIGKDSILLPIPIREVNERISFYYSKNERLRILTLKIMPAQ